MNPDIWGPGLWTTLHSITLAYPELPTYKNIQEHRNFIISLGNVLPCPGCQIEYKKYISKNPPVLHNKNAFIQWMIDLHNNVNTRLNKKIRNENYVLNLYKNKYSESILSLFSFNNNWSHPVNLLVFLIILCILSCFVYKKYLK